MPGRIVHGRNGGAAHVALEAGNRPQIIFQHYRELGRPKDAKSWFSITPGQDGKIVYFDVPRDGEQAATGAEKAEPAGEQVGVVAAAIRWCIIAAMAHRLIGHCKTESTRLGRLVNLVVYG